MSSETAPLGLPLSPLDANSLQRWLEPLTNAHQHLLEVLLPLANAHAVTLFLVGGLVRDAFLGRTSPDLDLMLEAPVQAREAFVAAAARALGWNAVAHPRFLTWRLESPHGAHLDLVTARQESYPQPGSLPEVCEGTALLDLARRDFTLNSMAVMLNGPTPGLLLDPHGGKADLEARQLRTLHARSFQDDPTRMLRAARFASRLDLTLEPETQGQLQRVVQEGLFDRLSGERVQHELALILGEEACARSVQRLVAWGVWEGLHLPPPDAEALRVLEAQPGASLGAWARLNEAHRALALTTVPPPLWLLRLGWVLQGADPARLDGVLERLSMTGRGAQQWKQAILARVELREWLAESRLPSERTFRLEKCSSELLGLLLSVPEAADPKRGPQLRAFLERDRRVRSPLDGRDLLALGWNPGPGVRDALLYLRTQALDCGWGEAQARAWVEGRGELLSPG